MSILSQVIIGARTATIGWLKELFFDTKGNSGSRDVIKSGGVGCTTNVTYNIENHHHYSSSQEPPPDG